MAPEDFDQGRRAVHHRQSVKNEGYSAAESAALLQAQLTRRHTDIPEKVEFFDAPPDYGPSRSTRNKKSKTDAAESLDMLQKVLPKARGD